MVRNFVQVHNQCGDPLKNLIPWQLHDSCDAVMKVLNGQQMQNLAKFTCQFSKNDIQFSTNAVDDEVIGLWNIAVFLLKRYDC